MRRASFIPVISWATSAVLAASLLWFIVHSVHWPLVGDAALMHYVVFLMDHGRAPYREIGDMNLPGAYLPNWLMVHAFGPSALAWRLYDLALLCAAGFAIVKLTRPASTHWGFWAAALFALIHGRDGLYQLGQRDLAMAVLLLLGTAALLCWPGRALYSCVLFGLGVGAACTIKPTGVLFLLLAWPWLMERVRARKPILRSLAGILAGFGLPLAVAVAWLMHHDALAAFLHVERTLAIFHASLSRRPLLYLVQHSLTPLLPIAALCLVLAAVEHRRSVKRVATVHAKTLLLGTLLGLVSYVVQGKGFPYHRYLLLAFLLPLLAMYFGRMLAMKGWQQWLTAATLIGTSLGIGAASAIAITHYDGGEPELQTSLEADLRKLNFLNETLGSQVQCLDSVYGCFDTLNRLEWQQATGTIYDEFLFHPVASPAVAESRAIFWRAIQADPPTIFVVTEPLFPDGPGQYAKLDRWPEFAAWLSRHYSLAVERPTMRRVHTGGAAYAPPGYRIYVLNTSTGSTIPSR